MKLRPVTKIGKRNKALLKKVDFILENYDVIVIFSMHGQFGAIRMPHFGRIVYKLIFSLLVILYLTKTESRTKIYLTQLSHYCFHFCQKTLMFCKNNPDISKIKGALCTYVTNLKVIA